MSDLEKTLAERGAVYGRFVDQAEISQGLKRVMRAAPGWQELPNDMRESLDSWHDVAGYVKLVEKRLNGEVV